MPRVLPFNTTQAALGAGDSARQHPGRHGVVDWHHPLARGLKFYTAFQENFGTAPNAAVNSIVRALPYKDRAFQHPLISTAGPVFSPFPSRTGPAIRFVGGSNQGIFGQTITDGATPALNAITKQITVACKFKGTVSSTSMVTKSAGNHLRDQFDLRIGIFATSNGSVCDRHLYR